MTREEAYTKRCCGPEGCGRLLMKGTTQERYCIASDCMAWLWDLPSNDGRPEIDPFSKTLGHCGLAK